MMDHNSRARILKDIAETPKGLDLYGEILTMMQKDYGFTDTDSAMLLYDVLTRYAYGEVVL